MIVTRLVRQVINYCTLTREHNSLKLPFFNHSSTQPEKNPNVLKQFIIMWSVCWLSLSTALLLSVYGQTNCFNPYSCALTTIMQSTNFTFCYGYNSCNGAVITSTVSSYTYCRGSFSCYQALSLQHTSTSTRADFLCHGLFSCAGIPIIHNDNGYIWC